VLHGLLFPLLALFAHLVSTFYLIFGAFYLIFGVFKIVLEPLPEHVDLIILNPQLICQPLRFLVLSTEALILLSRDCEDVRQVLDNLAQLIDVAHVVQAHVGQKVAMLLHFAEEFDSCVALITS